MKAMLLVYEDRTHKGEKGWTWLIYGNGFEIRSFPIATPLIDDAVLNAERTAAALNLKIVVRLPPYTAAMACDPDRHDGWQTLLKEALPKADIPIPEALKPALKVE